MEIFYILSILYIGTVIGASMKAQKDTTLIEELTVVCPKLATEAYNISSKLFKVCEHVTLPEQNAQLTKNDELCLLFYNTFILHCNTTQNVTTLFPTDIYKKYNLSTVCDNMAKLPQGTPNNSPLFVDLKKLIDSKEKCLEICDTADFLLPMDPFCSLSYYYISSFVNKTTKQVQPDVTIPSTQNITTEKQAPQNDLPQQNKKNKLDKNHPSNKQNDNSIKLPTEQAVDKAKVNVENEGQTNEINNKIDIQHPQEAKQPKQQQEKPGPQQPEPEPQQQQSELQQQQSEPPQQQSEPQQPKQQQEKPGPQQPEPEPQQQNPELQQPQQQPDIEQQPNDQFDSDEDMDIIDDDTKQLDKPKEFINNNNNNNKPNTVDDSQSIDYASEMEGDSYFFTYFMMLCIIFIVGYVCYHNKQKILALILEGRRGKRQYRSRRPNSANYHKLDSNLEEAITSSCNKNTSNVIY